MACEARASSDHRGTGYIRELRTGCLFPNRQEFSPIQPQQLNVACVNDCISLAVHNYVRPINIITSNADNIVLKFRVAFISDHLVYPSHKHNCFRPGYSLTKRLKFIMVGCARSKLFSDQTVWLLRNITVRYAARKLHDDVGMSHAMSMCFDVAGIAVIRMQEIWDGCIRPEASMPKVKPPTVESLP